MYVRLTSNIRGVWWIVRQEISNCSIFFVLSNHQVCKKLSHFSVCCVCLPGCLSLVAICLYVCFCRFSACLSFVTIYLCVCLSSVCLLCCLFLRELHSGVICKFVVYIVGFFLFVCLVFFFLFLFLFFVFWYVCAVVSVWPSVHKVLWKSHMSIYP